MEEPPKKRRKSRQIKIMKKWQESEIVKMLEYIAKTGDLEIPTAQIYYRKMLDEIQINATWEIVRWKIRYLKLMFRKACDFRNSAGNEMMESNDKCQIQEKVYKMCPHYDLLSQIFGEQQQEEPVFKGFLEKSSYNLSDEIMVKNENDDEDLTTTSFNEDYYTSLLVDEYTSTCKTDNNSQAVSSSDIQQVQTIQIATPSIIQLQSQSNTATTSTSTTAANNLIETSTNNTTALQTKNTINPKNSKTSSSTKNSAATKTPISISEQNLELSKRKLELEEYKIKRQLDLEEKKLEQNLLLQKLEMEKEERIIKYELDLEDKKFQQNLVMRKLELEKEERIAKYEIETKYRDNN